MAANDFIGCIPGRGAASLCLRRCADRSWPLMLAKDVAGAPRHEVFLSPTQARELHEAALALRLSPPRKRAWLLAAARGYLLLEAIDGGREPLTLRVSALGPRGGRLWALELAGGEVVLEALAEMIEGALAAEAPAADATSTLLGRSR